MTRKHPSSAAVRRDPLATVLKWVGAATAILSLVFGVRQVMQIVADARAEHRQVAELIRLGKDQQKAHDYAAAWASFDQAAKIAASGGQIARLAGTLSADQSGTREAQEDLAMVWLDDVHLAQGKTFSEVADPLVPVLTQGAESASGTRKADLLAHIGWANFLKSRDGVFHLEIEEKYREALQVDPDNPFAHAMWGHWLIADGNHLKEALQHFAAAVKSGRERPLVRRLEIAALQWVSEAENAFALIRVCDEMRKNNEPLSKEDRSGILGEVYWMHRDEVLAKLDRILPANEHLATYRWLLEGIDTTQSPYRSFFLARLTEAAGDCASALRLYAPLLETTMSRPVREGMERCKHGSENPRVGRSGGSLPAPSRQHYP